MNCDGSTASRRQNRSTGLQRCCVRLRTLTTGALKQTSSTIPRFSSFWQIGCANRHGLFHFEVPAPPNTSCATRPGQIVHPSNCQWKWGISYSHSPTSQSCWRSAEGQVVTLVVLSNTVSAIAVGRGLNIGLGCAWTAAVSICCRHS